MRTDAELLRSFDPEAFGEFYDRHVETIAAYLGRRIQHPDVLFDVLGETFARAYEHRRAYEPRKGPAIAWLLNTARYVLADAERRGQVPDSARRRLKLEPIVLTDAALATIAERGRADLGEALADLPESQRIAVYRRVLGDDEYEPDRIRQPIGPSVLILRDPELKRSPDPFELLGERLFLAVGGRLQRSRGRTIAIASVVVMLLGVGAAAAALRLAGGDEPATPTPTPTPTVTPTPTIPADPYATPRRPRSPRAQPRPGGRTPQPAPEAEIVMQLIPDLRPGHVGWCVDLAIRSAGPTNGMRGCTPSGPADANIIATGGLRGRPGAGYAVVDQSVAEIRLSDGRTITPELDPGMPTEWRSASWIVNGALPTFTLHDSTGRELPPFAAAPLDPLPTARASATERKRCAMRTDRRARSSRIVEEPVGQNAVSPSYLSCASAVFRMGNERLRATVLLDARDPSARAQDLVTTSGVLSVRRKGNALLVVYGGTDRQRARLLREIRVVR